jgi:MtN3 and saliva related transmembrane protein
MSHTAITTIGFIAGLLTTAAFVPQVVKIWKSRSARDISLGMYAILVSGIVLWLVYGVLLDSPPMILANLSTLVLALAILIMKLRFG